MTDWPYLLLLLPAVPLVWEDFRTRRISVVWLLLLGVLALGVSLLSIELQVLLLRMAGNLLLLLLTTAAMACYALVRRKPLRRFFRHGFGCGDVAVACALTPLFEPAEYLLFLICASLAALLWWCVSRRGTIPLAGFISLSLIGFAFIKIGGSWN